MTDERLEITDVLLPQDPGYVERFGIRADALLRTAWTTVRVAAGDTLRLVLDDGRESRAAIVVSEHMATSLGACYALLVRTSLLPDDLRSVREAQVVPERTPDE